MRSKTRFIIVGTSLCAYLFIRETLKLERRFDDLIKYEEEVNKVIDVVNSGTDIEHIISIKFK